MTRSRRNREYHSLHRDELAYLDIRVPSPRHYRAIGFQDLGIAVCGGDGYNIGQVGGLGHVGIIASPVHYGAVGP